MIIWSITETCTCILLDEIKLIWSFEYTLLHILLERKTRVNLCHTCPMRTIVLGSPYTLQVQNKCDIKSGRNIWCFSLGIFLFCIIFLCIVFIQLCIINQIFITSRPQTIGCEHIGLYWLISTFYSVNSWTILQTRCLLHEKGRARFIFYN